MTPGICCKTASLYLTYNVLHQIEALNVNSITYLKINMITRR